MRRFFALAYVTLGFVIAVMVLIVVQLWFGDIGLLLGLSVAGGIASCIATVACAVASRAR